MTLFALDVDGIVFVDSRMSFIHYTHLISLIKQSIYLNSIIQTYQIAKKGNIDHNRQLVHAALIHLCRFIEPATASSTPKQRPKSTRKQVPR